MRVSETPQASILEAFGAQPRECEELLIYNENLFQISQLFAAAQLPLEDESFVAFWEQSVAEASLWGSVAALTGKLPQLSFPIAPGISASAAYVAATRRGVAPAALPEATGLRLRQPESLEIVLHQSAAGRIPLLVTRCREDFVSLVQALTRRNEPSPIPAAMGAQMVSGYNNWARLNALRADWEASDPSRRETATWNDEMERLRSRRELYQDRFILLSDGPYSAVPAASLGLDEARWRELSLVIRREHECTHYFTRRLFGVMRNNLLDELIADYVGVASAVGHLEPAWLLRFFGLEDAPRYRAGGRLEVYRGTPPLSDGAFVVMQRLVVAAIGNLARFDAACRPPMQTPVDRALLIAALAAMRLEDLAADSPSNSAVERLTREYEHARTWRPAADRPAEA
jgi:hypothetical protein